MVNMDLMFCGVSNMKKILFFLVLFLLPFSSNAGMLYWFSASAVKKPSREIVSMFNAAHKKDKVFLITGGTGQLLERMILSKSGDMYSCMDSKFFHIAQSKGIVKRYIKFLKLTPVFGVSQRSYDKVKIFDDLFKKDIKLAVGNPKTMALGKTYLYILNKLPKNKQAKLKSNVIVKAINISQIVNYIKTDSVDAGLLFKSVANVNHIGFVQIPKQYNHIKTGYLVEMSFAENKKASDKLFEFIKNHLNVFRKYGFEVIYR